MERSLMGMGAQGMIVALAAFALSLPAATMRCQRHFAKMLGLPALAALGLLLLVVSPAYGVSLQFMDAGRQLDGDPILDILVTPDQEIKFTVLFNAAGSQNALTSIRYSVGYDSGELEFMGVSVARNSAGNALIFSQNGYNQAPGLIQLSHLGGDGIAAGTTAVLDVITFTVTKPVNDGQRDFFFPARPIVNNDLGGGPIDFAQIVEVQPAPEPTTLLLVSSALVGVVVLGRKALYKRRL